MTFRWRRVHLLWIVSLLALWTVIGFVDLHGSIAASTPVQASALYQPVGDWIGRLILPTRQQQATHRGDWVWLEVQHAPEPKLVGQVVRLTWSPRANVQTYVQTVTRNVRFTAATLESKSRGNIHPDRLNYRNAVGPLQSLAAARPTDTVTVRLDHPTVLTERGKPMLQLDRDPVQVTGKFYGLVKILQTLDRPPLPTACPSVPPCPSEFFQVQHFSPASGQFDGAIEVIRIPQVPADRNGIFSSTPRQLEQSPAGAAGWYVFGDREALPEQTRDSNGTFVVQAIEPRSLLQLQPDQVILGAVGLSYLRDRLWETLDKGTIQTALIDLSATDSAEAVSHWPEGTRALVLHVFGGIGGQKAEPLGVPNTITGHFAYGMAQVVRSPLTGQLEWSIEYDQVYAHNPNGTVAGTATWENYMGDLNRGWLGTRPVADILIRFEPLQDYDFDGVILSPFSEFLTQLRIMMARYRIGDGTGSATVTPASSCIQDSSQALYAAIARLKQLATAPAIQTWLQTHPDAAQTQRFRQLVALGNALEADLTPLGIVRADWRSSTIAGVEAQPFRDPSIWAGLTTWRTMTPRQAQDELAMLFLRQGAALWILRTNQVGGWDDSIAPLAPTALLGQMTIPKTQVSLPTVLLNRLLASLSLPNWRDGLVVIGSLAVYAAIALPIGLRTGFLRAESANLGIAGTLLLCLRVLIAPALVEELGFRVLLLPHPSSIISWANWTLWAIASLILFLLYHPLNAKTLYRAGAKTFTAPTFLGLAALLGLICTIAYAITGSLLAIVVIHWAIVVIWLLHCGGLTKLTHLPRFISTS